MLAVPPETEALTRRLAEHKGRSPEEVLKEAVEAEARLVGLSIEETRRSGKRVDITKVGEIMRRVASRPLIDRRNPKTIRDEVWGAFG